MTYLCHTQHLGMKIKARSVYLYLVRAIVFNRGWGFKKREKRGGGEIGRIAYRGIGMTILVHLNGVRFISILSCHRHIFI